MSLLTIKNDESFLRQKSLPVNFEDSELKNDIKKLISYTKKHDVWAMASIQLGIPKRIIYIGSTNLNDKNDDEQPILLINPKITFKKGKTLYWEACQSCMPNIGLVQRPYMIQVEFQDEHGETKKQTFEGFGATVVSHEIDHLEGILHMDRAIELRQLPKSKRIKLREQEPYKIISTDCDFKYPDEI